MLYVLRNYNTGEVSLVSQICRDIVGGKCKCMDDIDIMAIAREGKKPAAREIRILSLSEDISVAEHIYMRVSGVKHCPRCRSPRWYDGKSERCSPCENGQAK